MTNPWTARAESVDAAIAVVNDVGWFAENVGHERIEEIADKARRHLDRLYEELWSAAEQFDQRQLTDYQIDRSVEQIIDENEE